MRGHLAAVTNAMKRPERRRSAPQRAELDSNDLSNLLKFATAHSIHAAVSCPASGGQLHAPGADSSHHVALTFECERRHPGIHADCEWNEFSAHVTRAMEWQRSYDIQPGRWSADGRDSRLGPAYPGRTAGDSIQ